MLSLIYNYKYLTPIDLAGFDKYQVLLTTFIYSILLMSLLAIVLKISFQGALAS